MAIAVAAIRFCRSVLAWLSSSTLPFSSWLTVVSSSLIDCSSSRLVSSSSVAERSSSFIACSSSLLAFSSCAATLPCSVASRRCHFSSSTCCCRCAHVGVVLRRRRLAGRCGTASATGSEGDEQEPGRDVVGAADAQDRPTRWRRRSVERRSAPSPCPLRRLAARSSAVRSSPVSARIDGEQQVVGRLAAPKAQIAAGALGEVDDLVLARDDDRGRREALDQLQVQLAPRADAERLRARPGGEEGSVAGDAGNADRRGAAPACRRSARATAPATPSAASGGSAALARPAAARRCGASCRRRGTGARPTSTVSETPRKSRPSRPQREMDDLERAPLRVAVQVDEEVAAA